MNDKNKQIQRILDDSLFDAEYQKSKEDTLRGMLADFYNKKMRTIVVIVWVYGLLFIGLAIWSGIKFFDAPADDMRALIGWATLFLTGILGIFLIKIFAWQIITKNNLKREIKRLELRVADLINVLKESASGEDKK